MKDWTGNKHSTFVILGASNHTSAEREPNDYYATHPKAAEMLCDEIELSHRIWECACGEGHLAKVFERRGHEVKATDLIFRGYGDGGVDFLSQLEVFDGDIVTNPPYKYATEFVKHALELVPNGRKVAMFLKITFLEGKRRYEMFRKTPPPPVIFTCRLRGFRALLAETSGICRGALRAMRGLYGRKVSKVNPLFAGSTRGG